MLCCCGCSKDPQVIVVENMTGSLTAQIRSQGIFYKSGLPAYPLRGAVVKVFDGDAMIAIDSSDLTGALCITNIPVGTYNVEVSYKTAEKLHFQTTIADGKVTELKSNFFDCLFLPEFETPKTRWTVIHFVNLADVQLEVGLLSDIRMIEKCGGSGTNVNHVVYIPATGNYATRSAVYHLEKPKFNVENEELYGALAPRLFSPGYFFDNTDYEHADPSDYKLLEKSIVELSRLFPSDSLMLAVYDHGTGIDIDFLDDGGKQTRSISGNFATKGEITMPQLREVLANVRGQGVRVDALVFGACLMAAYEVGYELKDCGVRYIVASEPPSSGLHFGAQSWVADFNKGNISGFEVCRRIVDGVGGHNVFALWDMSRFDDLTVLYNDFAKEIAKADVAGIRPLIAKTVKVGLEGGTPAQLYYSCYDLGHFARNVSESDLADAGGLKESARKVADFLEAEGPGNFIAAFHNLLKGYENARGVGIVLRAPDHPYEGHNRTVYRMHSYYLDGNRDWDDFLTKLDQQ